MLPKTHGIVGAIISILAYFIFSITFVEALIIFLSSFLVDIDHYLYYVYKTKNWSLKQAYNWFLLERRRYERLNLKQKQEYTHSIFFLHGLEILISLLFLLIFVHKIFLFVLIGVLVHLLLDFISIVYKADYFYPKTSWIYTFIRNKKRASLN
jgi:membrane-bound metal-dependent hydrolase YbcI (DUF457 family)